MGNDQFCRIGNTRDKNNEIVLPPYKCLTGVLCNPVELIGHPFEACRDCNKTI